MDEELPKKTRAFEIGQDLSLMSADELRAAVEMLRAEIARIEAMISSKSASRDAAEAFFRR
ncbi:MAG: DUF1192 domain-containing protein [Oricola sp.]